MIDLKIKSYPKFSTVQGISAGAATQCNLTLKMQAVTANITESTLEGRTHYVIPVVCAIGNRVTTPMSLNPCREFIPAEVLGAFPAQWEGRPVVLDHPPIEDEANSPEYFDSIRMGWMFNVKFDDSNRLTCDAWIDKEKCTDGSIEGAEEVLSTLLSGAPTEVSIGVWRGLEMTPGVYEGEEYDGYWIWALSNHLAFLPIGKIGACAVEDGCGSGRLVNNQRGAHIMAVSNNSQITQTAPAVVPVSVPVEDQKSSRAPLFSRFLDSIKSMFADVSTGELQSQLSKLLANVTPGYAFVVDYQVTGQDPKWVVYEAYLNQTYSYYMRWFTVDVAGKVSLTEAPAVAVDPSTKWVSRSKDEKSASCDCDKKSTTRLEAETTEESIETPQVVEEENSPMSNDKSTPAPVIAPGTATVPEPAPVIITVTPAVNSENSTARPLATAKDWLVQNNAPPGLVSFFERAQAAELARREAAIIAVLENQPTKSLSRESLQGLETEVIVQLANSYGKSDAGADSTSNMTYFDLPATAPKANNEELPKANAWGLHKPTVEKTN